MPRPSAEAEGCRTQNAMKRTCLISLFILLVGCTPVQTATPTPQAGVLSLDIPPDCMPLQEGLCLVSEPGELLGGGKTTVIAQKPEATFLGQSTAIQVKVEEWTLVFDPGEKTQFSVGMTFPNAKLYPQGKNVGMSVEHNGQKCDQVDGAFADDTLQSAQIGDRGTNPISWFDIHFAMKCNGEFPVIRGRVKLAP